MLRVRLDDLLVPHVQHARVVGKSVRIRFDVFSVGHGQESETFDVTVLHNTSHDMSEHIKFAWGKCLAGEYPASDDTRSRLKNLATAGGAGRRQAFSVFTPAALRGCPPGVTWDMFSRTNGIEGATLDGLHDGHFDFAVDSCILAGTVPRECIPEQALEMESCIGHVHGNVLHRDSVAAEAIDSIDAADVAGQLKRASLPIGSVGNSHVVSVSASKVLPPASGTSTLCVYFRDLTGGLSAQQIPDNTLRLPVGVDTCTARGTVSHDALPVSCVRDACIIDVDSCKVTGSVHGRILLPMSVPACSLGSDLPGRKLWGDVNAVSVRGRTIDVANCDAVSLACSEVLLDTGNGAWGPRLRTDVLRCDHVVCGDLAGQDMLRVVAADMVCDTSTVRSVSSHTAVFAWIAAEHATYGRRADIAKLTSEAVRSQRLQSRQSRCGALILGKWSTSTVTCSAATTSCRSIVCSDRLDISRTLSCRNATANVAQLRFGDAGGNATARKAVRCVHAMCHASRATRVQTEVLESRLLTGTQAHATTQSYTGDLVHSRILGCSSLFVSGALTCDGRLVADSARVGTLRARELRAAICYLQCAIFSRLHGQCAITSARVSAQTRVDANDDVTCIRCNTATLRTRGASMRKAVTQSTSSTRCVAYSLQDQHTAVAADCAVQECASRTTATDTAELGTVRAHHALRSTRITSNTLYTTRSAKARSVYATQISVPRLALRRGMSDFVQRVDALRAQLRKLEG